MRTLKFILVCGFLSPIFSLELVNLIKNAGFEKDTIWIVKMDFDGDSTQARQGKYSGSCDTRKYLGSEMSRLATVFIFGNYLQLKDATIKLSGSPVLVLFLT